MKFEKLCSSVQDMSFGTPVKNTTDCIQASLNIRLSTLGPAARSSLGSLCIDHTQLTDAETEQDSPSHAHLSPVAVKRTASCKIIPPALLCHLCGVGAGRSRLPGKDERQNFGGWKEWQQRKEFRTEPRNTVPSDGDKRYLGAEVGSGIKQRKKTADNRNSDCFVY